MSTGSPPIVLDDTFFEQQKHMLEQHSARLAAELSAQLSAGIGAMERLLQAYSVRRRLNPAVNGVHTNLSRSAATNEAAEHAIDQRMDERLADTGEDLRPRMHRRTSSHRTRSDGKQDTPQSCTDTAYAEGPLEA